MKSAKAVWDYSRTNGEVIAKLGVPITFVPFGYAPYYEQSFRRHTENKNLQPDFDVLFFGAMSHRRRCCLEQLERRGIKVRVLQFGNALYGEELDELLARSVRSS